MDGCRKLIALRPVVFSRRTKGCVWSRWETAFFVVFHGIHAPCRRAFFKFGGTDLTERRMATPLVIQVDDATPIVLSFDKFVIRGIHGSAGLSRCTRH